MTYKAIRGSKMAEKERYGKGCVPDTMQQMSYDVDFKADTIPELVEEIKDWFNVDIEAIVLVENTPTIEVYQLENDRGQAITWREREEWENGEIDVWNCIYSFHIVKQTEVDLSDVELEKPVDRRVQ